MESMLNDITEGPCWDQPTTVVSFFFHRRGELLQSRSLELFRSLLHQLFDRDRTLLGKFVTATRFEEKSERDGEPGSNKSWDWKEQ